MIRKPPKKKDKVDPRAAAREQAKRSALNALKRAKRAADKAGVTLSEWENEFIGSVSQRIETFGRAFADPEKGAPGQALSGNQAIKLKEIAAKVAQGNKPAGEKNSWPRKSFGRKARPDSDDV